MRRLLRAFDRYWFAAARLQDLALFRILCVGSWLLFFYPGMERTQPLATADAHLFRPLLVVKLLMWPLGQWGVRPGPMFLHAVFLATMAAGVFALIGKYHHQPPDPGGGQYAPLGPHLFLWVGPPRSDPPGDHVLDPRVQPVRRRAVPGRTATAALCGRLRDAVRGAVSDC